MTAFAVFLVVSIGASMVLVGQRSVESEPCSESAPRPLFMKGRILVCASVADTPEARQQGLSGRAGLGESEGMLFVFPKDGEYAFWMKDMRFSIDILWLSGNGTIVYMA